LTSSTGWAGRPSRRRSPPSPPSTTRGAGQIAATPATVFAKHGDWARVGDYLLLWHAGWNYVCLERVMTAALGATT
jgi:hypothetical protein